MVNIGTYNIPEVQKQYAKLKDELEFIDRYLLFHFVMKYS
jgi:hypothetical protein